MNMVYICQTVDLDDDNLASKVEWIKTAAAHPLVTGITVLPLKEGRHDLPPEIRVRRIGRTGRIRTMLAFYRQILTLLANKNADFFFVHMDGPYPLMLWPFKLLLGKKIFQWKTHPRLSPLMKLSARVDTLVFTASPSSFPLALPNVRVVGHGVDTTFFSPGPKIEKTGQLAAIGRITPIKNLERMLRTLAACRDEFGVEYTLDCYGSPKVESDQAHLDSLSALIRELGLENHVRFKGSVDHDQIPAVHNSCRLMLNFSDTGLDKAAIEAMSSGLPVLTTNPCAGEVLPPRLRDLLFGRDTSPAALAKKINSLMSMDDDKLNDIGLMLRADVLENHSLTSLFDKIMNHVRSEF